MIICADARSIPLADKSVHCCVTSPPYWGLRDYGVTGQLGLERTPEEYISSMVAVFREVKRVLREDGTLWLNVGDSYAGSGKGGNPDEGKQSTNRGSQSVGVLYGKVGETARQAAVTNVSRRLSIEAGYKPKDLVGIPWMLAFALRSDGWYLRSDIIWAKPNGMPESVEDRPTRSHEYIFLLAKSQRYYYNGDAILEPASMSTLMDKRLTREDYDVTRPERGFNGQAQRGSGLLVPKRDKQRGHARPHEGSLDYGTKEEQCSGTRQKRDVWTIPPAQFPEAHFATFPEELIKPCILAGCPAGGFVLDPFVGSGTTILVAENLQCKGIGLELNPQYIEIAKRRLSQSVLEFSVERVVQDAVQKS